jgi:C-terminal processing protease CtpA/Prc
MNGAAVLAISLLVAAPLASESLVVLQPSARLPATIPFDRAISGLALRAEGPEYRTFRVREVLEDSAATEAGIHAGDVITAIDGTDAAGLTLTAINEMLENAIARALVIRRGDATVNARITPRRLP